MLVLRKKRKINPVKYSLYVIFSIALIFYQQFYPENSSRIFFSWYSGVSVITNITKYPYVSVVNGFNNFSSYISVAEENRRLKQENLYLKSMEKRAMFLAKENKELRYLINMSEFLEYKTQAANVYLDSSNLYVNSFIINLGLNNGIKPGFPVINQEGLIGRILESSDKYSRVLAINDYNAAVPVRVLESGVQGILKGRNDFHSIELITKEKNDNVEKGQHVVTSSLQGLFDDGIPVGVVSSVKENKIYVAPYANLNRIHKVLVVKR